MEEKMNQRMGIMDQHFMEQLQKQQQIQRALEEKFYPCSSRIRRSPLKLLQENV